MPSCVRPVVTTIAVLAVGALLAAQSPTPASAYRRALQRETDLRAQLDSRPSARETMLKRVRAMVAEYERLSTTYPSSGYSDNALWQAALLAEDAFWRYGDAADRRTARRLLDSLAARFPASSLVARIADVRQRLDRAPTRAATVTTSARTKAPPAAAAAGATLTAIHRELLPDAVRLTLVLERETPFSSERLEKPARIAIDLRNTRVLRALKDVQLAYPADVVRKVHLAHQDDARTRILIDLERAARYSIYPVYDPYRLIIDVERRGARAAAPSLAVSAPSAAGRQASPLSVAPVTRTSGSRTDNPFDSGRPAPAPRPAIAGTATSPLRPTAPTGSSRSAYSLSRQLGLGAARVVIDPGHGGHDPGAQSAGLDEAALVLDVALRLEQLLRKSPGVDVVLTRRTSEYVPLEERTAIANRANADLFLSIHANASPNPAARGIETYFLNFAPDAAAEAIAARENAASGKTMHNLTDIVRAITLNDKIGESRDFAMSVQQALYAQLRRTNKQARSLGVKQAPFQVLIGATMPSVLAEISFLTNEREGELLKSDRYRDDIAAALFDGVMRYQRSLKAATVVVKKAAD